MHSTTKPTQILLISLRGPSAELGLSEAWNKPELDLYNKKIQKTPEFYGKIEKDYRPVRLKSFPYLIVYEIIEKDVVVFAVFHNSEILHINFKV